MNFDHFELRSLNREWRSIRQTLTGRERRDFPFWVLQVRPAYCQEALVNPALFHAACRQAHEAEHGDSPGNQNGLGIAVLLRYASDFVRAWLRSKATHPNFGAFVECALKECTTERALRRWLEHFNS